MFDLAQHFRDIVAKDGFAEVDINKLAMDFSVSKVQIRKTLHDLVPEGYKVNYVTTPYKTVKRILTTRNVTYTALMKMVNQ